MFSQKLRTARAKARLTQKQLSDVSGVAQSQISLYECGKQTPTLETYEKLMDACDAHTPEPPSLGRSFDGLGEHKPETLDRVLEHLLQRLMDGDDAAADRILAVMDAAMLLKANHAIAADEAVEELGLVDWHRGVLDDSLKITKQTSQGKKVRLPYGETAKSRSARELARLAEVIGERRKSHVPRRALEGVIVGMAVLVREKMRQAVGRGDVDEKTAKTILEALADESRRQWAEIVYG